MKLSPVNVLADLVDRHVHGLTGGEPQELAGQTEPTSVVSATRSLEEQARSDASEVNARPEDEDQVLAVKLLKQLDMELEVAVRDAAEARAAVAHAQTLVAAAAAATEEAVATERLAAAATTSAAVIFSAGSKVPVSATMTLSLATAKETEAGTSTVATFLESASAFVTEKIATTAAKVSASVIRVEKVVAIAEMTPEFEARSAGSAELKATKLPVQVGERMRFPFAPLGPTELKRVNATHLLPLSMDCTEDGTGAAMGPRGGCSRIDGFKFCDESVWEGGWALHRRRLENTVKICDGPISKIYCTIHSNKGTVSNNDPVARFCWVRLGTLTAQHVSVFNFHGHRAGGAPFRASCLCRRWAR